MAVLLVLSAPSGAGKTSLATALVQADPGIGLSVSYTTRGPRPGERDGEHYYFVDAPQFARMADEGAFLEHAQVYDHRYGTARARVEAELAAGRSVILDIDWQGARAVRRQMPGALCVFILPPSQEALRDRLVHRGQDTEAVIARRMARAQAEMSHWAEFDFVVVNDEFDAALADLRAILAGRGEAVRAVVARVGGRPVTAGPVGHP